MSSAESESEKNIFKESMREIVIGSVSGAVGKVVEFPCDTIKVRLQYSQSLQQPLFTSTFDAIRKTYQREGILNGFYKGLRVPMMGAALEVSCLFFSYNLAQDMAKLYKGKHFSEDLKVSEKLLCGGFSGICTSFILTPIELVKCKFQVENLKNMNNPNFVSKSIPQIMKDIYNAKGIQGLWRGHLTTMIRECGGSMAWFGNYEFVISWFANGKKNYEPKVHELMLAGAMAGIGYHCTLFPADTVKSILQTNDKGGLTLMKIVNHIWRTKGFWGFYSGIGVTLAKSIPTSAVMFVCYEKLKKVITF
ncbi:Ort1 protein [Martiniozyma asiatica (nom. inval.)]|nr:Ort1 protein [Martiniozyma asiatica]